MHTLPRHGKAVADRLTSTSGAGSTALGGSSNGGSDASGGSVASGGSAASGGTVGSGGDPGAGGGSGNCDPPLVWLVVATSSGMFDATLDGAPAWPQIVDALVGETGAVTQLDGQLRFALTLFTGPTDSCPAFTTVEPGTNNVTEIQEALGAVGEVSNTDTPAPAAFAEALDRITQLTTTGPRYLLVVHHSGPDFCDDGNPLCPRDRMIYSAQQALAQHDVRTLVAGVELPTGDGNGEMYFQALAQAGQGLAVEPLADEITLGALCQAPYGSYSSGDPGSAAFVYGDSSTTDFAAVLSALLSNLDASCP